MAQYLMIISAASGIRERFKFFLSFSLSLSSSGCLFLTLLRGSASDDNLRGFRYEREKVRPLLSHSSSGQFFWLLLLDSSSPS